MNSAHLRLPWRANLRISTPGYPRVPDRCCSPRQSGSTPAASGLIALGENVRAGQPILMIEASGKQWLSFNAREDDLGGLTVGKTVNVTRNGAGDAIKGAVTELRPLGAFATWQAERVIGDHDRNTLRLRLDPQGQPAGLEPGMTVWIEH